MNKDQASLLREKFSLVKNKKTGEEKTGVRALSFTSGKGGVGKTSIVTNIAIQFAQMGKKVFLIDADLGLANIDIMLNLTPKFTIEDVLKGKKHISDVILSGPGGIDILPAASGVSEMSELNAEQQMSMLNELGGLKTQYDYILIDTGAGIASSVLRFNAAADEICVITNTEPTAMTDAYALMKIMAIKYQIKQFNLIVNQSKYPEAKDVYDRLNHVFNRFLPAKLVLTGFIPRDPHFSSAIKQQKPLTLIRPDSITAKAFKLVAEHLEQRPGQAFPEEGQGKFWERLKHWKKVF